MVLACLMGLFKHEHNLSCELWQPCLMQWTDGCQGLQSNTWWICCILLHFLMSFMVPYFKSTISSNFFLCPAVSRNQTKLKYKHNWNCNSLKCYPFKYSLSQQLKVVKFLPFWFFKMFWNPFLTTPDYYFELFYLLNSVCA